MFVTDLEEKIYQGGQISKEEALLLTSAPLKVILTSVRLLTEKADAVWKTAVTALSPPITMPLSKNIPY